MLIKINIPITQVYDAFKPSLAKEMARRFKAADIPFSQYIGATRLCTLLNIPQETAMQYLKNSPSIHGIETPEGTLLVHPDGVFKKISKKFIDLIKKEIKKKVA